MEDFVHLHVHTEYSLLDGATRMDSVFKAVRKKGMHALAITDHGNVQVFPAASHAKADKLKNPDFKVR